MESQPGEDGSELDESFGSVNEHINSLNRLWGLLRHAGFKFEYDKNENANKSGHESETDESDNNDVLGDS